MNIEALESRLISLEGQLEDVERLKSEIKVLEQRVVINERQSQALQDIGNIKRLQCAYGYYLEHWMSQEIIDCFSNSPEVSGTFVEGTYQGPEGIRRYFQRSDDISPEFIHLVMQVSPVITMDPDGNGAKGRWYGYGTIQARAANGIDPIYMSVIYEMEYIKENYVWKILKLQLHMHYAYSPIKNQAKKDEAADNAPPDVNLSPDVWADYDTEYPSGYIYPFHYKHPVTGAETTEASRNSRLTLKPNKYRTS